MPRYMQVCVCVCLAQIWLLYTVCACGGGGYACVLYERTISVSECVCEYKLAVAATLR